MSSPLLMSLLGLVLIVVGLLGLFSGKVMAGSKGLSSHHYQKSTQPLRYYFFISLYLGVGMLVIWHATHS